MPLVLSTGEHFDAIIIGCGMSGIAAGIRLAMYDKRILIVEQHNAPGGLNGFYFKDGRKFDVGLHAVTNYVAPGTKRAPLTKLLRQLRIDRDALDLCPQISSRIVFPDCSLGFSNEFGYFENQVAEVFPKQMDGFRKLVEYVRHFDALNYNGPVLSARTVLKEYISDPLLINMLMCPMCYYGSARDDNDMDFDQFVVMFESVLVEGFCRPFEGVRRIIKVLLDRYREVGGKRKMRAQVKQLLTDGKRVSGVELVDGTVFTADQVLSSAGLCETLKLLPEPKSLAPVGTMSFVETIQVLPKEPKEYGIEDTIVFFSRQNDFHYASPTEPVDLQSGVICMPNNYDFGERSMEEGMIRLTAQAHAGFWNELNGHAYEERKDYWFHQMQDTLAYVYPHVDLAQLKRDELMYDMFTPKTVERFTHHLNGAVYGSPKKIKTGETDYENLFLMGTDQGFLGIIGSLLSGISMVNRHCLL